MKERLSLLPATTLLSQVIFGVCFGFLGLFLALPIVILFQVILQETWVKKAAEL
jgi:predicted PurR-regulated permease PerM